MKDKVRTILKEWLQAKDAIIFTDDIAIEEVTDEIYDAIAERMPTEEERDKAAREFAGNDEMFYEEEIFKAGWDKFRSHMADNSGEEKGGEK
jgi:hypothetical protein